MTNRLRAAPLLVISGPSGVGKTTLVNELLPRSPEPLRRAITATTRPPRPGEVAGVDYHFWSPEQFQNALEQGKMLEYACVHQHYYYGTPRSEVDDYLEQGIGVILVVDVQGAAAIRQQYPGRHRSIFLAAPDRETLRQRLLERNTESDEKIALRLKTAEAEIEHAHEFDLIIVNDDLENTLQKLQHIILGEFAHHREAKS